jgi:hypothetical protein
MMREQSARLRHKRRKINNSAVSWRAIWMEAIRRPIAGRVARGAHGEEW